MVLSATWLMILLSTLLFCDDGTNVAVKNAPFNVFTLLYCGILFIFLISDAVGKEKQQIEKKSFSLPI